MGASVLLWLVGLFVALLWIKRWLSETLHRVGILCFGSNEAAVIVYYIVLLPGVVLHECSHWVAATLLNVPTRGVSLLPQIRSRGQVQLGSVNVRRSDIIRESLIGLAPLVSGVAVILLLARWRFAIALPPPLKLGEIMSTLVASLETPDALLWLYLLFSISNAMLPSEVDREPWLPALAFIAAVAAGVYLTGMLRQIPPSVGDWFLTGARYLTFVWALATAIDIPVLLLLLGLEKAGEVLLGRKVEYRD
jgi:hypothetical protein